MSTAAITLTGFAGLVAGAFSMATGEYTSVASQGELARAEIAIEQAELAERPDAELAELTLLYERRGVDPDLALAVAGQLSRDPDQRWRIHAREELGIDPDALPSPWTAAFSSFVSFALGALLPVLPYLVGFGSLGVSAGLAGAGLFGAGAVTSRFTNRSWLYSGLRQLLLGAGAAAVTYGVGSAFGATVA